MVGTPSVGNTSRAILSTANTAARSTPTMRTRTVTGLRMEASTRLIRSQLLIVAESSDCVRAKVSGCDAIEQFGILIRRYHVATTTGNGSKVFLRIFTSHFGSRVVI